FGHLNSLYFPLVHVPLVVVFPSHVPEGKNVRTAVSTRDIPATITHLAGLTGPALFPGSSLERYWESDAPPEERLLSEVNRGYVEQDWYPIAPGNMKSLVIGRHHYIKRADGREEIYSLDDDPGELHDLTTSDEGPVLLQKFRSELETFFET